MSEIKSNIEEKQIHVKPNFYTYCFEELKIIAKNYGYNLVVHGSMNRDMDLIAIPWIKDVGNVDEMIKEFAEYLDAEIMPLTETEKKCFPHGRESRILNMMRSFTPFGNYTEDKQYYVDISIMPALS
jgi:hypothetical protein